MCHGSEKCAECKAREHHARLRYLAWCRRHRLAAVSVRNFYWYAGQVGSREAALLTGAAANPDEEHLPSDTTITDKQKKSIEEGDYGSDKDVETNTGDGSDASGEHPRHKKQSYRKRAYGDDDYEPGGTSDDFYAPAAGHEYHDPLQQGGWKMTHADDEGHAAWAHPSGHAIAGRDGPDGGDWQLFHPSGQPMGKPFRDPSHAQEAVRRHLSGHRKLAYRTPERKIIDAAATAIHKQAWSGWGPALFPKTRQVTGWDWNNHLNGYLANRPQHFACACGDSFPAPSGFHRCACGRQFNSYVIGTGGSNHQASADKFIVREIPVRDDVIVANRHLLTDPGQLGEGEDDETPTMKRPPADWARRGDGARWQGSPIGA